MGKPACLGCGEAAGRCVNGDDRPAAVHEHEYNEWWCKVCWDGLGAPWAESRAYEVPPG